jgi:TRAP-type mannitol/chloroaromatic compound transport system substrate-binding protein
MFSEFEASNVKSLRELKEKYKVEVLGFPADVIKELKRLSKETLDEEANKDASFKKVYDAYREFQSNYADWNAISDDAYSKALRE